MLLRNASIGNKTMNKIKNEITVRTKMVITFEGSKRTVIDKIGTINF